MLRLAVMCVKMTHHAIRDSVRKQPRSIFLLYVTKWKRNARWTCGEIISSICSSRRLHGAAHRVQNFREKADKPSTANTRWSNGSDAERSCCVCVCVCVCVADPATFLTSASLFNHFTSFWVRNIVNINIMSLNIFPQMTRCPLKIQ